MKQLNTYLLSESTIVLIVVAAIILLLIMWVISTYNTLIRLKTGCEEAFSTMDVYLKKRFDLIPNLVATVKGYAKHEAETLERIVAARNANATTSPEQQLKDENQISGALRQIFALSERYPDLKANTSFMDLMNQLKGIEEDIANARKYYNAVIKKYNIKIATVPSNIIAGMFHFEKKPMFEVDDAAERKNVTVDFNN